MRHWIRLIEAAQRTVTFDKLWHIGSMDASAKRRGSYEGAGLSVSRHPQAWSLIARGHVSGDAWELTRVGNSFLDYHNIGPELESEIIEWGLGHGYVERHVEYRLPYYDDEWEQTRYMTFDSREQAEREAEGWDADPEEVEEHGDTIRGTSKLAERTMGAPGGFDALVPVWVEDCTSLDGVWWQDALDVDRLSAPRGVIVPSRVSAWQVRKLAPHDSYGSDEEDEDEFDGPDSPRA